MEKYIIEKRRDKCYLGFENKLFTFPVSKDSVTDRKRKAITETFVPFEKKYAKIKKKGLQTYIK